jgi:threonyl-tRNA synthetase
MSARRSGAAFEAAGPRCLIYDADETLARRVVAAQESGIPMFVTVGAKEAATSSLRKSVTYVCDR